MSKLVSLYQAKTHLSSLVEEAAKGEEIVISRNGKPTARLVPLATGTRRRKRKLGKSRLHFVETINRKIADAQIAQDFENSELWPGT